jgi:outer membrane protein assembly factor BamB
MRRGRRSFALFGPGVLATLATILHCPRACGTDWPQWLGPERAGVWRETGLVDRFPAGGPKKVWRAPLGPGNGGPAVAGGRVYVMDRVPAPKADGKPPAGKRGDSPGKERVVCLDATDGKLLWQHAYDCRYTVDYRTGPRTTPVVHGGRVYTLGTMGDLYCLDAVTGAVRWAKNLAREYGAEPPVWGWAASPLLDGQLLYCLVGGKGSAVVALDKDTGKEAWKALTAEEIGYSPPVLIEAGGKRQLIVWHGESVNGLDPATGRVYWTQPYPAEGEPQRPVPTIATVRRASDLLFLTSVYHGPMMLRLAPDRPAVSVLWKDKTKKPTRPVGLHCLMSTPVLKDGHIYGVCANGELRCCDMKTGDQLWETYAPVGGEKADCGTVFLVPQGERFVLFNDSGELILADLTPKGYAEIDRARIIEPVEFSRGRHVVWAHPAFANRCVYARNNKEIVCVSLAARPEAQTRDWPTFGGTPARNMANPFAGSLPADFSVGEKPTRNLAWSVPLGSKAFGGPVVAGGKVFVATNNDRPRDPGVKGVGGVLLCCRESDGKFLWQAVHPALPLDVARDARREGLAATPAVADGRVYYVTNRGELLCLDAEGDRDTHSARVVWKLDLMGELGVFPHKLPGGSPLIVGDLLFVTTGNGVDEDGVRAPRAPSLVAVDRRTGKVKWQDASPGGGIVLGQWSSPAYAQVGGRGQVIFGGGDGWLRAFEPATGRPLWKFNGNPDGAPAGKGRNYFVGTPVVHDGKVYIGLGQEPSLGAGPAHFWCLDLTRTGDGSPAVVWHYGGAADARMAKELRRKYVFGRTVSTCAIHDGLVYITEVRNFLHCLDARTGRPYWVHDLQGEIWGSPLYADGKIYVGTGAGEVQVFAAGKGKRHLATVDVEHSVHTTPVAANGRLYVATMRQLLAVGFAQDAPDPGEGSPHLGGSAAAGRRPGGGPQGHGWVRR